jgi:hypothetical protein
MMNWERLKKGAILFQQLPDEMKKLGGPHANIITPET